MVSKTELANNVKNLGWDKISLTVKKGYGGAVQSYSSSAPVAIGGQVPLLFGMHEAFIIEDDQGLYGVDDLYQGIIRSKDFDVNDSSAIEGSVVVAWEEGGEVHFDEKELDRLGINDFSVKESIKTRLLHLSKLDYLEDIPL